MNKIHKESALSDRSPFQKNWRVPSWLLVFIIGTSFHLPLMSWTCRTHKKLGSKSLNYYLSRDFFFFFNSFTYSIKIYINKYLTRLLNIFYKRPNIWKILVSLQILFKLQFMIQLNLKTTCLFLPISWLKTIKFILLFLLLF